MTSTRIYKILAVDDRPENLYALGRLLSRISNTKVIQAKNGFDALALTLEHEFCLAVVDVQMPEMDGYELVELLRGNRTTAELPVIFVSAIFSDEFHHNRGYDVGAVDFMTKPYNPDILLSKVRVFISLYEQRARLAELNENLEALVRQRTEELNLAYQRLEKMDKAKSDFIQVAAHELRTPITIITGYTSLLQDTLKDENQANMVRGIINGQERLLEIVNGMLDVTRIDSEALNLVRRGVSVAEIISDITSGLEQVFQERSLTFAAVDLVSLPLVSGDREMLTKVFFHLIINAVKFTPDHGSIRVYGKTIAGDASQTFMELIVEDTGIGISSENLETIFEKFYQTGETRFHSSGRTKFKGGGPGLGLSIVRGMIQAHGGKVWVESPGYDEENCPGSAFHIVLPIKEKGEEINAD